MSDRAGRLPELPRDPQAMKAVETHTHTRGG